METVKNAAETLPNPPALRDRNDAVSDDGRNGRGSGAVAVMPTGSIEGATVLSMLSRVIERPDVPIERMEQMFELYQRVDADRARREFAADMISAQAEMESIRKDASNPQTKSKYATFEALDRAARPTYTKYGFAPTYSTEKSDVLDHIKVVLTLVHRGGHERRYECDMPADGKGAKGGDVMTKTHAFGSAFSYGKRYAFGGAFNLVTTERDDDGNAAGRVKELDRDAALAALRALVQKAGANEGKICNHFSVESFDDLTARQISEASAGLSARIRKAKP